MAHGEAAAGGEPVDAVADAVAAELDAAVAAVGGFVGLDGLAGFVVEEQLHLPGERRPVAFQREQVVGGVEEVAAESMVVPKSLARRRLRLSQAKVRSTAQRLGRTWKPT